MMMHFHLPSTRISALLPFGRRRPCPRPRRRTAWGGSVERLDARVLPTAGALDTTFGHGQGYVSTDTGSNYESAGVVAVEPWDGKIVVGTHFSRANVSSNLNFSLIRYNTDGSLDTSFGSGGIVTTDFDGGNDSINTLLFTPDHKIDAVGNVTVTKGKGAGQQIGVARYNADGTLDTTFGKGGKASVQVSTAYQYNKSYESAATLDPSGRLVVAGSYVGQKQFGGYNYANALARFNSNGSLDTTFGGSGTVVGKIGSYTYDNWQALHLKLSGNDYKIDVVGKDGGNDGILVQFNSNGTHDRNFGTGGAVSLVGGAGQHFTFAPNGDLIATSNGDDPNRPPSDLYVRVKRYDPNGNQLFDKKVELSWLLPSDVTRSTVEEPAAVAFDSSGRIVIAGVINYAGTTSTTRDDSLLIRVDSSGDVDTTFGTNGVVIGDFGPYDDEFTAVTIAADDSIIASGYVDHGDGSYDANGNTDLQDDILIARYQG
jgi:uncharacterized delta-60 repeat protein